MSFSGSVAMWALRCLKPGKGSSKDLWKLKEKAKKENESFRYSLPKDHKAKYIEFLDLELPCMVIRPNVIKEPDKAVLYIYGGVSNNWHTQRSMAVDYAIKSGVETWYPVYPSMTEVNANGTVSYLTDVYRCMTTRFDGKQIVLCGVSMGGLFALQMISLINRRQKDLPMPGLIIAHSPAGIPDNEEDWQYLCRYENRDPLFSKVDLKSAEFLTPYDAGSLPWALYPAQGDFHNAPPTYLYYGEEMLAGNAKIYLKAFQRDGSEEQIHITVTPNMMHGYSCMPVFPESKKSYQETLDLIRDP